MNNFDKFLRSAGQEVVKKVQEIKEGIKNSKPVATVDKIVTYQPKYVLEEKEECLDKKSSKIKHIRGYNTEDIERAKEALNRYIIKSSSIAPKHIKIDGAGIYEKALKAVLDGKDVDDVLFGRGGYTNKMPSEKREFERMYQEAMEPEKEELAKDIVSEIVGNIISDENGDLYIDKNSNEYKNLKQKVTKYIKKQSYDDIEEIHGMSLEEMLNDRKGKKIVKDLSRMSYDAIMSDNGNDNRIINGLIGKAIDRYKDNRVKQKQLVKLKRDLSKIRNEIVREIAMKYGLNPADNNIAKTKEFGNRLLEKIGRGGVREYEKHTPQFRIRDDYSIEDIKKNKEYNDKLEGLSRSEKRKRKKEIEGRTKSVLWEWFTEEKKRISEEGGIADWPLFYRQNVQEAEEIAKKELGYDD